MKVEFAALSGTFDFRLLAMSAVLAFLMPYAGFELLERIRSVRDRAKRIWISVGGVFLGIGLWGAVGTVICSYQLPVPVRYHYPTVLLALLGSMLATTIGLLAATREYMSVRRALISSCLTGATATAVPYLCLKSFCLAVAVHYRWGVVGASACALIFLSVLVFDVGVLRVYPRSFWRRVGVGAIIGTAIVLWALGALWTVRLYGASVDVPVAYTFPRALAALAGIAGACFLVLSGTILITNLSRLQSLRQELFAKSRKRETFFNNLAEAIPGIVWIANEQGQTTYINRHWCEMTGTPTDQELGSGWMESIHPDDREPLTKQ